MTTGRIVYHFHTRTKTGRASALQQKAPDAFIEISKEDAAAYGVGEGQMLEVRSRRGYAIAPARITGIRRGVLFMPFHYGYWDDNSRPRAANEVTLPEWDPVSKQPHYKFSAVRIRTI
jgi:anaerobic selenocysteine-containing dehydrogenase